MIELIVCVCVWANNEGARCEQCIFRQKSLQSSRNGFELAYCVTKCSLEVIVQLLVLSITNQRRDACVMVICLWCEGIVRIVWGALRNNTVLLFIGKFSIIKLL